MTPEQFAAAKTRGEARLRGPRAASAHYDAERNRVIVRLTTGVEIGFAPRDVEGLRKASIDDLKAIEVEALGLGIHFPTIDADLYVPALLEGVLGSKRWMAAQLGAAGGRSRTQAKAAASRENGKRGGRPRKIAAAGERAQPPDIVLDRVVLFGSRARDDAGEYSDCGVAVFLTGVRPGMAECYSLADLGTRILNAGGPFFEAIPFRSSDYDRHTLIMSEIKRDGVVL